MEARGTMAERIRSHHDLSVWQLGMDLTEAVYAITEGFPKQETYGLTSQLRRAAASVPANIAEGNGRDSTKDYLRHLSIAVGSLCEVETFLQLAVRLRYADATKINPLLDMLNEEGRMLKGLQRSLRAKLSTT